MGDDEYTLDATPKAKPRKARPEADGAVLRLEAAFTAAFEAKWHVPPYTSSYPRARKHLKDLAGQLGEAEVLRLIEVYFTTTDYKVVSRDYTIDSFYGLVAHLRLLDQRRVVDARTISNIDAAARAVRRRDPHD